MSSINLTDLSDEQLVHRELQLERELIHANFANRGNNLDDNSVLGKLRKDIARARTAQRTRELSSGVRTNSLRDQHRSSFKPTTGGAAEGAKGFLKGIAEKISGDDDA
jgi:ribosomal protein L29